MNYSKSLEESLIGPTKPLPPTGAFIFAKKTQGEVSKVSFKKVHPLSLKHSKRSFPLSIPLISAFKNAKKDLQLLRDFLFF